MAPGAADRQRHEAAPDHVDAIVDDVGLVFQEAAADRQEPHRRERPPVLPELQLIGGDLLNDELIVGQVVIEGPDDPVAVGVGVREPPLAEGVALRIGVPRQVQPMPPPPLPVVGRIQQPVDQGLDRPGGIVVLEGIHFFRRRRQADQVELQPPEERPSVDERSGRQPFFVELREDEVIDGRPGPARRFHLGGGRIPRRSKSPMRSDLRDVRLRGFRGGVVLSRIGSSAFHPGDEVPNDGLRQFPRGRHLEFLVAVPDRLDEAAGFGVARHEGRTRVTALEEAGTGIEVQPPFELFRLRAVALEAVLDQDGSDLVLEEFDALAGGVLPRGRSRTDPAQQDQDTGRPHEAHRLDRFRGSFHGFIGYVAPRLPVRTYILACTFAPFPPHVPLE